MNLKMTNRFHQVLYMVALLIFAVALTTALVVAAEQNFNDSSKKTTSQWQSLQAPTAGRPGPMGCV